MIRNHAAALAIATIACTSVSTAQANLLGNGNFEASRISIAPWAFNGFAENIAVEDFATNGSVQSQAYGATVLVNTPHSIEQPVKLTQGKAYILRFDVHSTVVSTNWAYIDFQASIRNGTTWTLLKDHPTITDGNRAVVMQFGERFVPSADADAIRLEFTISGFQNQKHRFRLDEIELYEDTSTSLLYSKSTRYLPRWGTGTVLLDLDLVSQPGVAHVIYLSSGRLPTGVPIRGFQNALWLDWTGLFLPMTVLVTDSSGNATTRQLAFPNAAVNAIAGVGLHFQPIAVNPLLNILQFGSPTNLSYAK
ncbi:MAG: hypothetical protein KDC95_15005 [Planctomycetes bacterium]|nr:hypothetical protein [Planctomycetota bacterium]